MYYRLTTNSDNIKPSIADDSNEIQESMHSVGVDGLSNDFPERQLDLSYAAAGKVLLAYRIDCENKMTKSIIITLLY